MTDRLVKRHKRQVARAKAKVRISEPDVRTPEEVKAAQEASRPAATRRNDPLARYATGASRGHAGGPPVNSAAKSDG